MINCPRCNQPMQADPNDPNKVLCFNCRKRFDAAKVAEWHAARAQSEETSYASSPQYMQQPPTSPVPPQQQPTQYAPTQDVCMGSSYDPSYIYGEQPGTRISKGFAIASLVLGIVSLLNCWIPMINFVSILTGLIAIVLGIVSLRKVKKGSGGGKGMSIAGIVISAIGIVSSIAISALFVISLNATLAGIDDYYTYDDYMSEITAELEEGIGGYGGASDGYNDLSPWTKLEFSVNDKTYTLMESKLSDLEESGYTLDLEGQGYPDGYVVEPGQMISIIELEGENNYDEYFIVNVANLTEEPMDIKDCVLTKFDYDNAGDGNAVSISGISCGATAEQVEEVFGAPQDSEEDGSYVLYQYETRKYTKYFQVIFADGIAKGFTLSSMEY